MDTVDYTDAGVRQMKGIRHLSNWKLIIPLLLLTSYTACDIITPSSVPELADSNKQSENLTTCTGQTVSFTWTYKIQPFIVVEWYFGNTLIAQTSEESFSQDDIIITPEYTDRFQLLTKGKVGFTLKDVTKNDTGSYSCIITLESTHIPKVLYKEVQVTGTELGNYTITETNTTEDCRTLKCGEPVGTYTTYEWTIRVNDSDETTNRTTTNTFKFCQNPFNCSVKCQCNHDCTETKWMCFRPGQSGRRRRKRRTLDEQLVPCDEQLVPCDEQLVPCDEQLVPCDKDTDSGNLDDSTPITTGIVVAVVFAVIAGIAVIAIIIVVTLRKRKSRAGRRSDSFKVETPASTVCLELVEKTHQPGETSDGELEELKDSKHLQGKETCEQVNRNQTT